MEERTSAFLRKISFPLTFVGILWVVHLLQEITGLNFGKLGVYPRHLEGLPGILTSPLIHGSWEHLFYNSISFLILGAVIFWFYPIL